MDIQLEKKKGLQKKHIPYVAGGVLFVILLGWIIFGGSCFYVESGCERN